MWDTASSACDLYPIALNWQSLADQAFGTTLLGILNGTQPGNFGWLTWTGANGERALVADLTPPGDSDIYVNPDDPDDHVVAIGDWVEGRPGVANSSAVRAALNRLETLDITVPVWDQAAGHGATSRYRLAAFARVRLLGYQLTAQNRISARFLGYADCGSPFPTATATPVPDTATATPSATCTQVPSPTATAIAVPTDTQTAAPTDTPTPTPVPTDTATATPTGTAIPTSTATLTPTSTVQTATDTPTATSTSVATATTAPSTTETPTPTATATATIDPNTVTDLRISFVGPPTTPAVGSAVTFFIEVRNGGPASTTDVTANFQVPAGYTVTGGGPQVGSYDSATGDWTIGSMPAGGLARLILGGTVNATGPYDLTAETTASSAPDPNLANNTATASPSSR